MKIPGPDHPITITPADRRWRVKFQGHVIADSGDALVTTDFADAGDSFVHADIISLWIANNYLC